MGDQLPESNLDMGFHRIEYSVSSNAPLDLCWNTYVDWTNWPLFHPAYGRIEWTQGKPWERASHLSIEITHPIHINVEHVIIKFVPKQRIAWLDHSGFITIEQWVNFAPRIDGGTKIETWADIVGPATIKGMVALPLIKQFTKKWYNEFADFCDRLAAAEEGSTGAGDGDRTRDQRLGKP
jgi:hypothetical protein